MELAASHPGCASGAGWSSRPAPSCDGADRDRRHRTGGHRVDHVEAKPDGSHVAELWQDPAALLPEGPARSLKRASWPTRSGPARKIREGHGACSRYHMEERIGQVLSHARDVGARRTRSHPRRARWLRATSPGAGWRRCTGGSVALVDEMPEAFAQLVLGFPSRAGRAWSWAEAPPNRWWGRADDRGRRVPHRGRPVRGRRQDSRAPVAHCHGRRHVRAGGADADPVGEGGASPRARRRGVRPRRPADQRLARSSRAGRSSSPAGRAPGRCPEACRSGGSRPGPAPGCSTRRWASARCSASR